ncbi:hypothetical protein CLV62_1086 [Dysgonomonas alginatilytica]|uniref:Uncharacterized protein n=1 Tax=Dysgonomonas alginatilytica TaxID=1605892 RepID=A0A2V3PPZ8_9BACT|nr:hypothetical protein CLV62_1086 [Dysgonomonas alginatilytica]
MGSLFIFWTKNLSMIWMFFLLTFQLSGIFHFSPRKVSLLPTLMLIKKSTYPPIFSAIKILAVNSNDS